ncbi:hypothetical protein [Amycolatopsis sp. NPDC003731]
MPTGVWSSGTHRIHGRAWEPAHSAASIGVRLSPLVLLLLTGWLLERR